MKSAAGLLQSNYLYFAHLLGSSICAFEVGVCVDSQSVFTVYCSIRKLSVVCLPIVF